MDLSSKHPWLFRRKNTYYLRAKTPADLVGIFPVLETKRSLKTQDRTAASRLIHLAAAKLETDFAEYRRHGGPRPQPSSVRRYSNGFVPRYCGTGAPPGDLRSSEEMSPSEFERLVSENVAVFRLLVDEPVSHLSMDNRRVAADLFDIDAGSNASDEDDGHYHRAYQHAAKALEGAGFFFDRRGKKAIKLGEVLVEAEARAFQERARRLRGKQVENYFARAIAREASSSRVSSKTLNDVLLAYDSDPERQEITQKTRNDDHRTFELMREHFGGDTVFDHLEKHGCQAFRETIRALPKNAKLVCPGMTTAEAIATTKRLSLPRLSPKGANKYLHKLAAIFNYAIFEGFYDKPNPAHKLAVRHKHTIDARNPFSSEQLSKIFCSEVCLSYARKRHTPGAAAAFWVPLLALFMGLRQGEACQLIASDIAVESEIPFVSIQDTLGRHVKTPEARRRVPCHPTLLALGFLDFVETMRTRDAHGQLFPEEELGSDGHYSPYSKRFGRFLTVVGARRPKTAFHSFRHNFADALREADVKEELRQILGGWKPRKASTEQDYGSRPRIDRLHRELAKIDFAELPVERFRATIARV